MEQSLFLGMEDAELFWIERNHNHLTDLKPIVGNIKNRYELGLCGRQAQLDQRLSLVPFPGSNLCFYRIKG